MFTKLFSSILSSSIWNEPDHVRIVWITLLAMSDRDGKVFGSAGGIAHQARLPQGKCLDAIRILSEPDPDSRTTTAEGRRITKIDGGYLIVNYQKYRELGRQDGLREYWKSKKQQFPRSSEKVREVPRNSPPLSECSASVSVPLGDRESEGKGEFTWEAAKAWLQTARRNGADYSEVECRTAYLALQANGWRWGRNPVVDHRAALERQIQTDRDRRPAGKPKDGPPENSTLAEIARMDRMIDRL